MGLLIHFHGFGFDPDIDLVANQPIANTNIYANALFPANTAPNLQFAHPISIQAANSLAFVSTTRTIVKNIDPSDLLSFNEIRIV
jgi:hypothetical protein